MAKPSILSEEAAQLTAREYIIWFTTTSRNLSPQPRPVWFIWHAEHFLIYSRPGTNKVRHIQERPNVSLNFNTDRGANNDLVILKGLARIAQEIPTAHKMPAYVEKYAQGISNLGMSAEQFGQSYSAPIMININQVESLG